MGVFVYSSIFIIIFLSFVANPAPLSMGILDIGLLFFPTIIGMTAIALTNQFKIKTFEKDLLFALFCYLSYLVISGLIGLLSGIPPLKILRSIGPYLNFSPLILLGFLSSSFIRPIKFLVIFITVGLCQAYYHFYLYYTHSIQVTSTLGVLVHRITLIDPRTTLPLFLGLSILPFHFLMKPYRSRKQLIIFKGVAIYLILMGLFAGLTTLTRAIILSIFFGWIVLLVLIFYYHLKIQSKKMSFLLFRMSMFIFFGVIIFLMISKIHFIHQLEDGILARFFQQGLSNEPVDYSNGRLYDEWLPALSTWMDSGLLGILFGIGAGNGFFVSTGEERTYIHNLCIYTIVYGGFFGLLATCWFYFILFKTLCIRASQTNTFIYLTFAALLLSMFFYSQLFAIHKVLVFNAILFLLTGLALTDPLKKNN